MRIDANEDRETRAARRLKGELLAEFILGSEYDLPVQLMPIRVECYAGHKADEAPRRFLWQGEWVEVVEVVDRWYQVESRPEWPRADYFKVLGSNQGEYLLKHDLESDRWYLGQQWLPTPRPEPEGEAPR